MSVTVLPCRRRRLGDTELSDEEQWAVSRGTHTASPIQRRRARTASFVIAHFRLSRTPRQPKRTSPLSRILGRSVKVSKAKRAARTPDRRLSEEHTGLMIIIRAITSLSTFLGARNSSTTLQTRYQPASPDNRLVSGRSAYSPFHLNVALKWCQGVSDQFHILIGGHPFVRQVHATSLLCPSQTDWSRGSGSA